MCVEIVASLAGKAEINYALETQTPLVSTKTSKKNNNNSVKGYNPPYTASSRHHDFLVNSTFGILMIIYANHLPKNASKLVTANLRQEEDNLKGFMQYEKCAVFTISYGRGTMLLQ